MNENHMTKNKNSNNNTDDGTKSIVLSLETLSKEYDTVLIKYNQAQKDYIDYINIQSTEPNYNINSEPLTAIKGTTFWGSEKLNEGKATSIEQCKAMCSADASCSGATYNPDKAYCWTRKGEGSINTSIPNDYAIIPENLKYLKVIQGLSEQLTSINNKILKTINKGEPLYSEQDIKRKQQTVILNENYKKLMKEREKVEKTIKKYQDLIETQNQGELFINKNYTTYIFLILVILIAIFLFIKFLPNTPTIQQGGSLKNNTYFFIFILILIVFIIWNKNT
jgi:hypothetical protein